MYVYPALYYRVAKWERLLFRQQHYKGSALAPSGGFGPYRAAVQLDYVFYNIEAKAGSLRGPCIYVFGLVITLENFSKLVTVNAGALVGNADIKVRPAFKLAPECLRGNKLLRFLQLPDSQRYSGIIRGKLD